MQEPHITDDLGAEEAFTYIKKNYDQKVKNLKKESTAVGKRLSNVFHFMEEVYGEGQEMVIIVTELTANKYAARYISRYGCKEYFDHNEELLFYERQKEIDEALETLEL
jgi:Na+-translocating ferredoxin:NAD+ oxidoreductase RnfC subunit